MDVTLAEIRWPSNNINTRLVNQVPLRNFERNVGTIEFIEFIHPFIWRCIVICLLYSLIVFTVWCSEMGLFNKLLPVIMTCGWLHNVLLNAWLSGYGFQAIAAVVGGAWYVGHQYLCQYFTDSSLWQFAIYWSIRHCLQTDRWAPCQCWQICFYFLFIQTIPWPCHGLHSPHECFLITTNKPYANSEYK